MHFVYILQSTRCRRFYIGSSSDVEKRLRAHNRGGTRSTKPYRPWIVIYVESHEEKRGAAKREWHLKHPVGYLEKRRLIEQYRKNGGFA